MGYRSFTVQVFLRVAGLGIALASFIWLLFWGHLVFTTILAGLIVVLLFLELLRYVLKTSRDLQRLLNAIRYDDFNVRFSDRSMERTFRDLYKSFNDVTEQFSKIKTEKEEQYSYLHNLLEHLNIALVVYDSAGTIQLINRAFRQLVANPRIRNISEVFYFHPRLHEWLRTARNGQRGLLQLSHEGSLMQLSVQATVFKVKDKQLNLVSIQNIQSELDEKELESWQNLIRILTHEIMNSLTPITSLASTANSIVHQGGEEGIKENIGDLRLALDTIEGRAKGLLQFVDAYRKVARLPQPNFVAFPLAEMLNSVMRLVCVDGTNYIRLKIEPEDLIITADRDMLEQVLINLLENAKIAVRETAEPEIALVARRDETEYIMIQVSDNGAGIPPELMDQIFIPFFTTRKEGSGIGLSLSRQIVRAHGGSMYVQSREGLGTTFTMRFSG